MSGRGGPHVHAGPGWRWIGAGLLAGAMASGGLIALLARGPVPQWRVLALLAAAACLGIRDITGRRALTFPRRQTYSGATLYAGYRTGLLALGFDIGLGFTTFRTTRLYWIGVLLLASGSPAIVCLAGAIGYSLALLWASRKGGGLVIPERWIVRRRRLLGIAGAAVPSLLIVVIAIAR